MVPIFIRVCVKVVFQSLQIIHQKYFPIHPATTTVLIEWFRQILVLLNASTLKKWKCSPLSSHHFKKATKATVEIAWYTVHNVYKFMSQHSFQEIWRFVDFVRLLAKHDAPTVVTPSDKIRITCSGIRQLGSGAAYICGVIFHKYQSHQSIIVRIPLLNAFCHRFLTGA